MKTDTYKGGKPTIDQLYYGYAEAIGCRFGVRTDKVEKLLRSLDSKPALAYINIADKLVPIEKTEGRIVATMKLVDMIQEKR